MRWVQYGDDGNGIREKHPKPKHKKIQNNSEYISIIVMEHIIIIIIIHVVSVYVYM